MMSSTSMKLMRKYNRRSLIILRSITPSSHPNLRIENSQLKWSFLIKGQRSIYGPVRIKSSLAYLTLSAK